MQGIKFLNYIYSIYLEHKIDPKIVDLQIGQWLELLLEQVEITASNSLECIGLFLTSRSQQQGQEQPPVDCESVLIEYRHIIQKYVS